MLNATKTEFFYKSTAAVKNHKIIQIQQYDSAIWISTNHRVEFTTVSSLLDQTTDSTKINRPRHSIRVY